MTLEYGIMVAAVMALTEIVKRVLNLDDTKLKPVAALLVAGLVGWMNGLDLNAMLLLGLEAAGFYSAGKAILAD